MKKEIKPRKKFVLIAKVDAYTFVKYRFNSLKNVMEFMAKKWPETRYINFYYNAGPNKRQKFAEWGKIKGLIKL